VRQRFKISSIKIHSEFVVLFHFWGTNKKQRSFNERGEGAQRPLLLENETKKTGAHSAFAHTHAAKTHYLYIFTAEN
jgi:hypothetical protein